MSAYALPNAMIDMTNSIRAMRADINLISAKIRYHRKCVDILIAEREKLLVLLSAEKKNYSR